MAGADLPMIVECLSVDENYKKRHGNSTHLEFSKAKRLQNRGILRIVGKPKNNVKPKIKVITTSNKPFRERVEGKVINSFSIPVHIPWCDNGQIGKAYNDIMATVEDWVIFIDHDVLLVNPFWHQICVNAIDKVGHIAGWITCFTNRIGCKFQKAPGIDIRNDDIRYHRDYARSLYLKNKGKLVDLTEAKGGRFSGMFILTNKQAWLKAGGFNERAGFFGIDVRYFTAVKRAGFHVYRMNDLYVYHGYFREVLKPYFAKT